MSNLSTKLDLVMRKVGIETDHFNQDDFHAALSEAGLVILMTDLVGNTD